MTAAKSSQLQIRGVLVSVSNKFCANGALRAELRIDERGKLWKCVAFGDVAQWYLETYEGKQGQELTAVGDKEDSEFGDRIKLTHVPYSALKDLKQKHKRQQDPNTRPLKEVLDQELEQGLVRIYFKTSYGLTGFRYNKHKHVREAGYLSLGGYKYPRFIELSAIPRVASERVSVCEEGQKGQSAEAGVQQSSRELQANQARPEGFSELF